MNDTLTILLGDGIALFSIIFCFLLTYLVAISLRKKYLSEITERKKNNDDNKIIDLTEYKKRR